jgi:hypothetical protein
MHRTFNSKVPRRPNPPVPTVIIRGVTFAETMGHIADRFGRHIRVSIRGRGERGPALAADAVGTLAPGWDDGHLEAVHENLPNDVIHAFGLEELPAFRVYFDPSEFRGATISGDRLTIHVGGDVEISFAPRMVGG